MDSTEEGGEKQLLFEAAGWPTRKVAGGSCEPPTGRSFVEDDSYVNVNVGDYYPVTPSVRKAKVMTEKVQQVPPAIALAPAPAPTLETKLSEPAKFAYVFYATMDTYACGVLVNIARLRELNSAK